MELAAMTSSVSSVSSDVNGIVLAEKASKATKAIFKRSGRNVELCESDESTDEAPTSDTGDDSTFSSSPVSADGTSSDSGLESDAESSLAMATSRRSTPASNAAPSCSSRAIYPVGLLLRLRAACLAAGPSPNELRYGTAPRSPSEPSLRSSKETLETPPRAKPSRTRPSAGVPEASAKLPQSSANSWAAQRLQARLAAGSDEAVQVARAARSILNKLTADKFEALYEQLVTCGVKTPEHVTILMQEIFEKATTQHNFIAMYADLCMRLEPDPRIAAAAAADGQSSFRRLLLNQCQCAFEELLDPTFSCDRQDDEEARIILKQKTLGNVKFVGQLIVRRMLSSRLLCDCTDQLLGSHEACPEALESVAVLLRSACPTFDTPSWPFFDRLEQIFARVQELTVKKGVPSRIRFLLKDVLDLRKAGWRETPSNSTAPRAPTAAAPGPSVAPREAGGSPAAKKPKGGGQGGLVHSRGLADPSPTAPPRRPPPRSPPLSPQRVTKDEEEETAPSSPAQAQEPALPPKATEALPAAQEEKQEQPRQAPFSLVAFRRELSAILRDLGSDRNVGKAVKRVRQQGVPREHQAQQFADLLTRASEECRGPNRRSAFAFAAGLAAAAEQSAFNREECLAGTKEFFREVYPSLKGEVPRLPAIAAAEILPTLRSVLPVVQLSALVPEDLKSNAFTPEDLRSP